MTQNFAPIRSWWSDRMLTGHWLLVCHMMTVFACHSVTVWQCDTVNNIVVLPQYYCLVMVVRLCDWLCYMTRAGLTVWWGLRTGTTGHHWRSPDSSLSLLWPGPPPSHDGPGPGLGQHQPARARTETTSSIIIFSPHLSPHLSPYLCTSSLHTAMYTTSFFLFQINEEFERDRKVL